MPARPTNDLRRAARCLTAVGVVGLLVASCGRGQDADEQEAADVSEQVTIAPVESESGSTEAPTADDGAGEDETGLPTRVPELELTDFDAGQPAAGSDGVFTANPGQCLAEPEPGGVISCEGAHRAEVFYTFNLPAGDYPGDDAVSDEATGQCDSQVGAYLGGDDAGTYSVSALTPSRQTWEDDGDTEVLCLLVTENPGEESAFQSER
ncbi:septum formation family protein [Georgenia sp. Z1344]|uniref:septum formation family protein n=1 Tax=Georgenia sp. Z1344 TaxID=3416706 RepID=UPI003CEF6A79